MRPLNAALALCLWTLVAGSARAQWDFGPKEQIDYREPSRAYSPVTRDGATFLVERELLERDPQLAERAVDRVAQKRKAALAVLPPDAQAELRAISIYVMYGPKASAGGRANGLRYFPPNAPQFHAWVDPAWKNVIVVHSAENYVRLTDFWAVKALVHEYAHAHHLLHWPPGQPDLARAYEHARDAGLYRDVVDENGHKHDEAYPRVNALEYFAELSTMYFLGCNYFPHSKAELVDYDAQGAAVVRKLWGL